MATSLPLFYILLFVIAFLYASVGHGGASGYLALMALFNFSPAVMKPTALVTQPLCFDGFFYPVLSRKIFQMEIICAPDHLFHSHGFSGRQDGHSGFRFIKRCSGLFLIIPICRFLFFKNTDPKDMKPRESLSVVAHWCSHWFSIRHDRYWRRHYPFADPAFTEMDESETNGCYQRFIYFCELGSRSRRPVYQRNSVQYGNAGICGRRFCRWFMRRLYGVH